MQLLHDQLLPESFVRSAKELQHRHLLAGHRVAYRATFLLRVMLLGGLLKSSSNLKEALQHALASVPSSSIQQSFGRLVDECSQVLPSAASMSRWRFVLDAAIMVHHRLEIERRGDRVCRVLMADSSVQHNRDFEHILVSEIERDSLVDLLDASHELAHLWQSE